MISAILIFITRLNFIFSRVEHEKCFITLGPGHLLSSMFMLFPKLLKREKCVKSLYQGFKFFLQTAVVIDMNNATLTLSALFRIE